MRLLITASLILLTSTLAAPNANAQDVATAPPLVSINSGQVSGVALGDGLTVFRGIPFAAPPVGDLRWRPPAPVASDQRRGTAWLSARR